jgi:hypothetical protein
MPAGTERAVVIYDHFWERLTPEEQNDAQWWPDSDQAWTTFFLRERKDRLTAYDGGGDPPVNYNASGWWRWWSAPGRTLAWVLGYITDENDPPLQMPPRLLQLSAPRGNGQWVARRQVSSSSRSSSS